MRIEASCGNAPKKESLDTCVYSIKLTAQTEGDKRWMAGLLKALENITGWDTRMRAIIPTIVITEK